MRRSRHDIAILLDTTAVGLILAASVVLALPWWSYVPSGAPTTRTGWDALSNTTYGHGWLLIIAVVVTAAATIMARRVVSVVAIVICAAAFVVFAIGAPRVQSVANHDEHAHAGLWLGLVLVLLCVLHQLALVGVVGRDPPN